MFLTACDQDDAECHRGQAEPEEHLIGDHGDVPWNRRNRREVRAVEGRYAGAATQEEEIKSPQGRRTDARRNGTLKWGEEGIQVEAKKPPQNIASHRMLS